MFFYYIRHAQSTNNALYARTGSYSERAVDPELTPTGMKQAKILAKFLASGNSLGGYHCDGREGEGFRLTHLYSSLMVRSVATGTEIAKATGVPLTGWINLHETGGIFRENTETGERTGLAGYGRPYFEKNYPDFVLPDEIGEDGWWNNRPFEEHAEREARARKVLKELLRRHGDSDDQVAMISHGGFFNHLLKAILQISGEGPLWFTMFNAAITRIDFVEEKPNLVYSNRVDFLTPDLIT